MNLQTSNEVVTTLNVNTNRSAKNIYRQQRGHFETKFSFNHPSQKYFCKVDMVKSLLIVLGLISTITITIAKPAIKEIVFTPKNLVLGSYSADPQNDETFDRLKKAGFNYVHTYRTHKPEWDIKFFELARKYDMKVMYNLRARNYIKDGDEQWLSTTMKTVEHFNEHPSLGMWYLWDEPTTEMLPNVAKLREEIRKVSDVPTSLVIHWRKAWENTRGYSDIWMVDTYPVRGQDFPNAPLQHYTAFVSGAARCKLPGTPFIPVMQACDFTCFPDQARNLKDKSKLRYPNLTEMRFMAFSSLTYGIHGLFFYSYHHSHLEKPEGQAFFYKALAPLLTEIKAFDAAVGQPWNVKQNFKLNKQENINLGYWERKTGNFMVMTNNSPQIRNLKINLTQENDFPTNKKLIPWGETNKTNAMLDDGVLSIDNVQPWETFVWQVK